MHEAFETLARFHSEIGHFGLSAFLSLTKGERDFI
jgi:hypothetical protein